MKLFDDEGHLSEEGFSLLLNDGGDELQRLEISEHLSFCDACLATYLEKLESQALITPVVSRVEQIRQSGARRGMSLFYRRFTVVAATFLAMILWSAGAFSWQYEWIEQNNVGKLARQSQQVLQMENSLEKRITSKYHEWIDAVNDWGK